MESQSKRRESERLVQAYRAWASEVDAAKPGQAHTIFMDDLSRVPRMRSTPDCQLHDWESIFRESLKMSDVFSEDELLKIRQSLAFSNLMDSPPTRESVLECGGVFEASETVLSDIEKLTSEIVDLEKFTPLDFPTTSDSSYQYALKIAEDGFRYIQSRFNGFKPLDFEIVKLSPASNFVAQVTTDKNGKMICEIPFDRPVNASLAGLMIHEILGHVFHFTQLQHSEIANSSPHLLCISVHTHEGFFVEAFAQLMTSYISSRHALNVPGQKQIALYDLRYQKTQALAHYLIANLLDKNLKLQEAVKIHYEQSNGSMSMEFLEERYTAITSSLFSVRTALNYYPSFKTVKPLIGLSEEDFFKAVNKMANGYFTPESLKSFVAEYAK